MPHVRRQPANAENGGGGQAVIKQSKNQALAAAFLKWLNSDDGSDQGLPEVRRLPVHHRRPELDPTSSNRPRVLRRPEDQRGARRERAKNVATGWQYLPFQVYANSIFGDTVGQAYVGTAPERRA